MRLPLVLVALSVVVAGCFGGPEGAGGRPDGAAPGAKGPEWSFTDTEGVRHARDAAGTNATVLFFMASWCGSCKTLTGPLARVHADYAAKGVRFLSLTWDATDTDESLRSWKQTYANPWPHGKDPSFSIQKAFGVASQSSVVVLDKDGFNVNHYGYAKATEADLRQVLDAHVAKA